jgi:hypothetical protein
LKTPKKKKDSIYVLENRTITSAASHQELATTNFIVVIGWIKTVRNRVLTRFMVVPPSCQYACRDILKGTKPIQTKTGNRRGSVFFHVALA